MLAAATTDVPYVSYPIKTYLVTFTGVSLHARFVSDSKFLVCVCVCVCVVIQGIGVVLPVENKMKTPEVFGGWFGVIDLAMTIAMVLYAAMGFYGYLRFGKAVQGSITLNLPCHEGYVSMSCYSYYCPMQW